MVARRGPDWTVRALLVFVAFASLLYVSCGHRDRANPLDPLNPSTGGVPPGFETVALDGRVELRWTPIKLGDLSGYNVYRRQGVDGRFQLLDGSPLPSDRGSAIDSFLTNGTSYFYRMVPVIEAYGEGTPSPLFEATPGRQFAVVVEPLPGTVTRFSADLRASVWTAGGFYYPFAIATDGDRVWVTDLYGGVVCLSINGTVLWRFGDVVLPLDIAADRDGVSAVADAKSGTVTVLSRAGEVRSTISQGLSAPASVSFGADSSVWVADPGSGRVNKYSVEGVLLGSFAGCVEPRFLDAGDPQGACWVVDAATNEVVKLSSAGQELFRASSFSRLGALGVDKNNGGCWVSDLEREEVAKITDRGDIQIRVGRVGRVVSVYVTSDDGSVWLADEKGSRILVVSRDGRIVSSVTLSSSPASVTVTRER